jgi:hypothetical protein
MIQVTNNQGITFNVRVLVKGSPYGLEDCLTHDKEEPVIEFYDTRHSFDMGRGQFVARYYLSTLIEAAEEDSGLDLCGYEPSWKITAQNLRDVVNFGVRVSNADKS